MHLRKLAIETINPIDNDDDDANNISIIQMSAYTNMDNKWPERRLNAFQNYLYRFDSFDHVLGPYSRKNFNFFSHSSVRWTALSLRTENRQKFLLMKEKTICGPETSELFFVICVNYAQTFGARSCRLIL